MKFKHYISLSSLLPFAMICMLPIISGCDTDEPTREDVPELITKALLTFAPNDGGIPVTATATDPDGEGVQSIQADEIVYLPKNKTYTLSIQLINELASPTDPAYYITEEIKEEGDEHMFFFGWTNNIFASPSGNGNIDNRDDAVSYEDRDDNDMPIGLVTSWVAAENASGTFRVVLKHQPGVKSTTSASNQGETDLDVTFSINVL